MNNYHNNSLLESISKNNNKNDNIKHLSSEVDPTPNYSNELSISSLKKVDFLRRQLKMKRKNLTIWRQPWLTITNFYKIFTTFISFIFKFILFHQTTYIIILPILIIVSILCNITGFHSYILDEIWIYFKLIIWWVGLGFLSSVGLGSGMHTGFLFLFPHIFLICSTSEECNSLDFDARISMWHNVRQPLEYFECTTQNPSSLFDMKVTILGLILKTFKFSFLWGIGSAIGELPPYIASYAAAKARLNDEEFEEIKADLDSNKNGLIKKIKSWTMKLIKNYGSISVFLLSSWPNVFFDFCGIICGHFLMPFWQFFIPLAIGKGVVKVFLQSCFFVFLFSSKFDQIRAYLLTEIANIWPIRSWIIKKYSNERVFEDIVIEEIKKLRSGMKADTFRKGSLSVTLFFTFITALMFIFFFIRIIEQCAQIKQKELDEQNINQYIKNEINANCKSF